MTDHGGAGVKAVTAKERPDLVELAWAATKDTLPEYNNHGDVITPTGTA